MIRSVSTLTAPIVELYFSRALLIGVLGYLYMFLLVLLQLIMGPIIFSRLYDLRYWHSLSLALTFFTSSIACWTRVYGAHGPLYSWDWCLLWAPYFLVTCLDGLRGKWPLSASLLTIPSYRVCSSIPARCALWTLSSKVCLWTLFCKSCLRALLASYICKLVVFKWDLFRSWVEGLGLF